MANQTQCSHHVQFKVVSFLYYNHKRLPLLLYIYILHFTFMHLADAFIQSDLHCIQVTVLYILSALAFPGNRTHNLGVASAMLYHLSYRKALCGSCLTTLLKCFPVTLK